MKRCLFHLAAAVSLAVCIAMVVAWIRSHRVVDDWFYSYVAADAGNVVEYHAYTDRGWVLLNSHKLTIEGGFYADAAAMDRLIKSTTGFRHDTQRTGSVKAGQLHRAVPIAVVVPPLALLPLVWVCWKIRTRQRVRYRVSAGACLTCGYDLRATPDRCPECGLSSHEK